MNVSEYARVNNLNRSTFKDWVAAYNNINGKFINVSTVSDATVEIETVADLVEKLVKENASKVQDHDDYEIRYQALTERYNKAKDELEKANNELFQKKTRQKNLEAIAAKMEELDSILLEWSDEIWLTLIEEAVAHENGTITFKFKNGYTLHP